MLPEDASVVEVIKYKLCCEFVKYLQEHELKQFELAEKLKIAKTDMSEILNYRVENYSIDRLVKLLESLNKKITIKIA